jgi:hypothetical protein
MLGIVMLGVVMLSVAAPFKSWVKNYFTLYLLRFVKWDESAPFKLKSSTVLITKKLYKAWQKNLICIESEIWGQCHKDFWSFTAK